MNIACFGWEEEKYIYQVILGGLYHRIFSNNQAKKRFQMSYVGIIPYVSSAGRQI